MKFKCKTAALAAELKYVISAYHAVEVAGEKRRLPVRFATNGNMLELASDDRKVMLVSSLAVEDSPEDAGENVVHGDVVAEYLRMVRGATVCVEVTPDKTSFTHDDGMMAVPNLLVRPNIRALDSEPLTTGFTLPRKDLQRLLDTTSFAAIKQHHQYVSGTALETGAGRIRMVATDINVMAIADAPNENATGEVKRLVIPVLGMDRLRALLRDNETDVVEIEQRGQALVGKAGHRAFLCQIGYGAFPWRYEAVIPTGDLVRLDALCATVADAVKRGLAASDGSDRIDVDMSQEGLRLSFGNGSESVSAFCKAAEPVTFAVSGKYLLGILKACPTERIELLARGPRSPILMVPVGTETNWKAVVSPING